MTSFKYFACRNLILLLIFGAAACITALAAPGNSNLLLIILEVYAGCVVLMNIALAYYRYKKEKGVLDEHLAEYIPYYDEGI